MKKGDLLFVIDPRPYQAELERAKADWALATARLERTEKDLARAQKLLQVRAASQEEVDTRVADQRQAQESVWSQHQQARRDLLRASAQASAKAVTLARLRYQFGVADFLTVLDAERTLLNAWNRLAESETRTATTLIAVYKALGGGWEQRG